MSTASQFKGVQYRPTASKAGLNSTLDAGEVRGGQPNNQQLRISYGEITKYHENENEVDVKLFGRSDGQGEGELVERISLVHPQAFYHLVYGQIRPQLVVRIFWKGTGKPGKDSLAEIVDNTGGARFRSGVQEKESNAQNTGPWKIFSGGLG